MCRVFTEDSTLRAGGGDGGDERAAGGVVMADVLEVACGP